MRKKINKELLMLLKKHKLLMPFAKLLKSNYNVYERLSYVTRTKAFSELFIDFFEIYMIKRNLWETFINEIKWQDRTYRKYDPLEMINYNLTWFKTKKGEDFWYEQDKAWRVCLMHILSKNE